MFTTDVAVSTKATRNCQKPKSIPSTFLGDVSNRANQIAEALPAVPAPSKAMSIQNTFQLWTEADPMTEAKLKIPPRKLRLMDYNCPCVETAKGITI
jgi:hypothetical protein